MGFWTFEVTANRGLTERIHVDLVFLVSCFPLSEQGTYQQKLSHGGSETGDKERWGGSKKGSEGQG